MKEDSRALLKLLLERGQSYEDIGGVLGSDRGSVRERAHDALEELGGQRPDPGLADYLLGEASPVERADMARRLSTDDGLAAQAAELGRRLRELAPQAVLPDLPDVEPEESGSSGAPAGRDDTGEPRARPSRGWMVVGAAALVVLVVGAIVIATGDFGGDDEALQPEAQTIGDLDAVPVELSAPDDGDADGEAVLGLATGDQPFVDVTVRGLEALPGSDAYILWLMADEQRGWPLGLIEPDDQGSHSDRYPVPAFLLETNVIKGLSTIVVSRSPREQALDAADKAAKQGNPEVDFVGEVALSGEVPNAAAPAPRGN